MNTLPLEGMRVVEIGQIVAGPTAGLILGGSAHARVMLELGYSTEQTESLARRGVVHGPDLPRESAGSD